MFCFSVSQIHGKRILKLLQKIFSWLPLATVIDQKVLVLHGGISDTTDLSVLARVDRHGVRTPTTRQTRQTENADRLLNFPRASPPVHLSVEAPEEEEEQQLGGGVY